MFPLQTIWFRFSNDYRTTTRDYQANFITSSACWHLCRSKPAGVDLAAKQHKSFIGCTGSVNLYRVGNHWKCKYYKYWNMFLTPQAHEQQCGPAERHLASTAAIATTCARHKVLNKHRAFQHIRKGRQTNQKIELHHLNEMCLTTQSTLLKHVTWNPAMGQLHLESRGETPHLSQGFIALSFA